MKKIATLLVLMLGFVVSVQAQKLSKADMAKYETEINALIEKMKKAVNDKDVDTINGTEKEITDFWTKVSTKIYGNANNGAGPGGFNMEDMFKAAQNNNKSDNGPKEAKFEEV